MDEARLITAAQAGDKTAFEQLVDGQYGKLLFALALRRMHNREDAEDVYQETLLLAWRGIRQWKPTPTGSFKGWLVRILVNTCNSAHRRAVRRTATSLEYFLNPTDAVACPRDIEGSHNTEIEAIIAIEREAIRRLVDQLPARRAQVIHGTFLEGRRNSDIAVTLDISPENVGATKSQALAQLRSWLAPPSTD